MDYGAVPPEITSGLIYTGPGSGPLMAAAAAWDGLAAELDTAASGYSSVIAELTGGPWLGPAAASMVSAAAPFVSWLVAATAQAEQAATQARAAAAAFEAAFTMTVPPPVIAANRMLLATLIATNFFGQNTPAIAATEAEYLQMWAQDAAAMYGYAAASAAATELSPFESPPGTTTPGATANQGLAVAKAVAEPAGQSGQTAGTTSQLVSMQTVPQALQHLSTTAASNPAVSATDPPWWSGWFTIPTPDNPMGLTPSFYTVVLKNLTGFPYFGTGLGSFGYSIQQQLTFGAGTTAGAAGAWYPTPQFAGLAALGGGHPGGVGASFASSTKIGGLSVPSAWGSAPSAAQQSAIQATTVSQVAGSGSGPTNNGILQGMPAGGMGRRGASGFTHKYGFKHAVLARPPSAG